MFYFGCQKQKMPSNYFQNWPIAGNHIRPRRRPSTVSVKTVTAETGKILFKPQHQDADEGDQRINWLWNVGKIGKWNK
jgi:hypothetical protein